MRKSLLFAVTLLTLVSPARSEVAWTAPASAAEVKPPFAAEPKVIAVGQSLYEERCADCHGKNGNGNGPGGSDLEKKPTNFTDGKILKQTDGELYWKITEGHKPMPSYRKKLLDEQRWQLVHYLRTFAKKQ